MKERWFNFRITDKEKTELEKLASKEGRSVANFLKWLVQLYKEGRLVKK